MKAKDKKENKENNKIISSLTRRSTYTTNAMLMCINEALRGKVACFSSIKGDVIIISREKYDKLCRLSNDR